MGRWAALLICAPRSPKMPTSFSLIQTTCVSTGAWSGGSASCSSARWPTQVRCIRLPAVVGVRDPRSDLPLESHHGASFRLPFPPCYRIACDGVEEPTGQAPRAGMGWAGDGRCATRTLLTPPLSVVLTIINKIILNRTCTSRRLPLSSPTRSRLRPAILRQGSSGSTMMR